MKILKFGGSSVKTADRIRNVIDIVLGACENDGSISVVVSAFGGVTNQLLEMGALASEGNKDYIDLLEELKSRHFSVCNDLLSGDNLNNVHEFVEGCLHELQELLYGVYLVRELTLRAQDLVLSFGERLSAYVISAAVREKGVVCKFVDARELIVADDSFGSGHVRVEETNLKIRKFFEENHELKIITGFIAVTENGLTVTLGRDGSDYTASVLAAALMADAIEIWTDVDGVMTCDPRKVKDSFPIAQMTYEEAMELSHFGAEVIHPPTVQPALKAGIPIHIRNSMNPTFPGTVINGKKSASKYTVKGITSIDEISILRLQGSGLVNNNTKFYERLFRALSQDKINVVLISQASSEQSICFAIPPEQVSVARSLLSDEFKMEIQMGVLDEINVNEGFSVLAIVGSNMKNTIGVSGKLFNSLAEAGVSAVAIAQGSSELNISVVVHKNDEIKALDAIHETFFFKDNF